MSRSDRPLNGWQEPASVRNPNLSSGRQMTTRGWWLVILNVLIPGSAQVVAGNRRLGRIGLFFTLVLWAAALSLAALFLLWRDAVIALITIPFTLVVVQTFLVTYAVLWLVLTLDTLRIIRLVKTAPGARPLIVTVTIAALLATSGIAAYGAVLTNSVQDATTGLHRSSLADLGVAQNTGETNILVMGLDSRLDENGDALPDALYTALQAGTSSDGGYNTNVLMLIHIPAGGGKAVGISIPRDDYVAFPDSPDGSAHGKIKEAYGLKLDETLTHLVNTTHLSHADAYQQARAAARQEEVTTVSQFLGGVAINHFVEITMAAFFQVAQAVQPITVCLNEATQDPYSGANFVAGQQQLTAEQAVSFVRQRRDESNLDLNFSDLDRERRQQAFIVSLAYKLRQAGTFTDAGTLQALAATANRNVAVDSGLNLLSFAQNAQNFSGGGITFTTLPISGFDTIGGQDVNVVDLDQIHSTVAALLAPTVADTAAPAAPADPAPASGDTSAIGSGAAAPAPDSSSPAAAPNVNTEWSQPLQSGGIPCVK